MNSKTTRLIIGIVVALVVFLGMSLFTVDETEAALVLRLGKLRLDENDADAVMRPGLHFRIPFVETVRYVDTRLQTLEIQSSRIVTKEKKDVIVDSFIKWRVSDVSLFFRRTSANRLQAELLLRQKAFDGLRAEFGRHTIKEVVSGERLQIMENIREQANESAKTLGIEVVDARIKAIDLPVEVSEAVFDRMRTERERVAAQHRAQGKEKAEVMRADTDAKVTVLLAEAAAQAQRIRGEGDAAAAKIYAEAYSKDPEFYRFTRSLEAYQQAFQGNNNVMVLKPDSEFFKFFRDSGSK